MRQSPVVAVFLFELRALFRRPMFWSLLLVCAFLAKELATGRVRLGTGSAMVGGMKAWITSEHSNAFVLAVLAASMYSFFVSIASGLSLIRDRELAIDELIFSTAMLARDYAWAKWAATISGFSVALFAHVCLLALFNHLIPSPAAADIRGPFVLGNYVRPALIFAIPTLIFFSGITFYFGERFRSAALAFLAPVGVLLASFTIFWNWAPSWLDPRINRLLMLLDASGFRWLNETLLKLDRGAEYYNSTPVALDLTLIANRLLFTTIGLAAVYFAGRHLERNQLATPPSGKLKRVTALPAAAPVVTITTPGLLRSALTICRIEASLLAREPGLYLFGAVVLAQSLATSLIVYGPFQTPLLATSGQLAASSFNTLSLLVCLLMMLFLVEALERERGCRLADVIHSAPVQTISLLLGKILGVSVVAVLVLFLTFLGGSIAIIVQGHTSIDIVPYALVWGLLLLPTFLVWCSFITFVKALVRNRYLTYGIGLAALTLTLYQQFGDRLSWAENWLLWGTVRWSDVSVFGLDRTAIVLNRAFVLSLAMAFLTLATHLFRRRVPDPIRAISRLSPGRVLRSSGYVVLLALLPAALFSSLWLTVLNGRGGEVQSRADHDYWARNFATWDDQPQPSLVRVDLDLRLEPQESAFETSGTYAIYNFHDRPLERFAVTGGRHWRDVSWTLDAVSVEPDNRSLLYVFDLDPPLPPGETRVLGFSLAGRYPNGISENGEGAMEFILPDSVVLTGFRASFAPVLGYSSEIGIHDDNRFDPREFSAYRFEDRVDPAFASSTPFDLKTRINTPEDFTANGIGTLTEETVAEGRRIRLWESDHPVRMFNVVAGRWSVEKGEGTAIYYHPGHPFNIAEMSAALDASRRSYSEWFGEYPWHELKVSAFPSHSTYAQGFPTNITFSESIGFLTRNSEKVDAVKMVTAHETAHQWWGNLLLPGAGPGAAILSEGMSHFSTLLLFEETGGKSARRELARRFEERYGDRRRADAERPLKEIDGTQPGDTTVIYDKGGWVMWMLMEELGRDQMLDGLRTFITAWQSGPDHPLLPDLIAHLRPLAEDPASFDRFIAQWFDDVAVPEYSLSRPELSQRGTGWRVSVEVSNQGSGQPLPVVVAATADREHSEHQRREDFTTVLGAGESKTIEILVDFEPDSIVVDPDVKILQLNRKQAMVRL